MDVLNLVGRIHERTGITTFPEDDYVLIETAGQRPADLPHREAQIDKKCRAALAAEARRPNTPRSNWF